LTTAQAAGQAGTWAAYVAALPAALAQPHPAVALSAVTAAWGIPPIAARLAGGITDRYGPRRTGAASWALAEAAAAVPAVTRPGLPTLLVVLAVVSLGGSWGVTAGEAAPTWLPGLASPAKAGPCLATATNLALITGPVGASNVLTHASDRAAWVLVIGLSAAAALGTFLVPARPPEPASAPASQRRTSIPAAARRVLALTAGVYLTIGVITVLEPLYVRQVLHSPLTIYGWLLAVWGGAGILTSLAATRWPVIAAGRWAVPAATLTLAAGELLYVNTAIAACAFAGVAVFGTGAALFRLSVRAVIVNAVPAHAHGRALGLWETIQNASSVAPTAATGALVTLAGLRLVLACCGSAAGAVAALTLAGRWAAWPASRSTKEDPSASEEDQQPVLSR
jgi:predicted MFS family arabinose efflux permease